MIGIDDQGPSLVKIELDLTKNKKVLLMGEKFCQDLFNGILS